MRKLVSVRIVDQILPIPKADLLEVAVIGGWSIVVKRGEFKPGDKAVYFEIDSFLPASDARFEFLVSRSKRVFEGVEGHRLRSIKLRGQLSQGLILPLAQFPEIQYVLNSELAETLLTGEQLENANAARTMLHISQDLAAEDLDFSTVLGIKKYEAPLSPELAGQAKGLFPSFVPKTDAERCQNLVSDIFGYTGSLSIWIDVENAPKREHNFHFKNGDRTWIGGWSDRADASHWAIENLPKASPEDRYEVTIKLDGSSMTAYYNEGETGICSRNLELQDNDENASNTFVTVFRRDLKAGLFVLGQNIAIQGELMGPGIQGNREQLTDYQFFVFNIYDIDAKRYLNPHERHNICLQLIQLGANIKHAPVLHRDVTLDELGITDIQSLLKFAEGPSLVNKIREGVVFKRADGFNFKAISNLYLLSEEM